MARPRFLFTPTAELSRSGEAVAWRLVGANNHELARSAGTSEGLAACRASVVRLQRQAERLRVYFAMSHMTGMWTWKADLDGHDVAISGRSYRRHRECQYNLGLFLVALPVAQLTEGLASRPRLRGLHLPGSQPPARVDADDEGPHVLRAGGGIGAGAGAS